MKKQGTERRSHLPMNTQQISMELRMWSWAGLSSQPLYCQPQFSMPLYSQEEKRTQRSTKAKLLLKGYLLYSKTFWARVYWNPNSSCSRKLEISAKTQPDPKHLLKLIKHEGEISRWRDQWKIFYLTSNYLLAISPNDVTELDRMF